jgi:hypothetical protein
MTTKAFSWRWMRIVCVREASVIMVEGVPPAGCQASRTIS